MSANTFNASSQDARFARDKAALETAWKATDLARKIGYLNDARGDRFEASVAEPQWRRDLTGGDYKAPIHIVTITINAQHKDEKQPVRETLTVSFHKDSDGDLEYHLESEGLVNAANVKSTSLNKVNNTFDEWRAAVQAHYTIDIAQAIQQKATAYAAPANPPQQPAAKP